ncbi:MAG: heavy metal-associated domain-containing protein [Thermodesulfovibrionales bacterium]
MEENTKELFFKAEDITCSSCATDMENILQETEGIINAAVDFAEETVLVRYNPQKLGRKEVFFAVRKLGYKIKIIAEK